MTKLKLEGPSGDVEEIPVTRRPMLVTPRLEYVASGALSLRLEWKGTTAWLHRVVPRREAFDRKELVGLAAWDSPVTSNNAGDLSCTSGLPPRIPRRTPIGPRRRCAM